MEAALARELSIVCRLAFEPLQTWMASKKPKLVCTEDLFGAHLMPLSQESDLLNFHQQFQAVCLTCNASKPETRIYYVEK